MENVALIKEAQAAGVLTLNELEYKALFTRTSKDIATFSRVDGKTLTELFAEWLGSHADGAKIKGQIKSQIKPAVEPVS